MLFLRINLFLYALPLGVSNLGFCESHIGKEKVSVSVKQYFIEFYLKFLQKIIKESLKEMETPILTNLFQSLHSMHIWIDVKFEVGPSHFCVRDFFFQKYKNYTNQGQFCSKMYCEKWLFCKASKTVKWLQI